MSIPKPRFFRPIVIDGTNNSIVMHVATVGSDFTATIANGTYYSPESLIYATGTAINTALNGAHSGWSCVSNVTGWIGDSMGVFYSCYAGGSALQVKWTLAPGLGALLGFDTSADHTYSSGIFGIGLSHPNQIPGLWFPGQVIRSDTRETSAFSRAVIESTGGVVGVDLTRLRRRKITFEKLLAKRVFIANEQMGNEAGERLWRDWPGWFVYHADSANTGLTSIPAKEELGNGLIYALDEHTAQAFLPKRAYDALDIYNLELGLVGTH